MIKVALISGDSSQTGAPAHVCQLATGLKLRGFEVILIAPPGPLLKCVKGDEVKSYSVEMHGPFDRKAYREIREILQKFAPDIIHFHGVRGGWLGRLAARKLDGPKRVYTEHLWTKYYHLSNPAYERFQLEGLKFMERWTDKTIAVSSAVRDFLLKRGFDKNKLVVIPNGISSQFLKLNPLKKPKEAPLIIGSVGSLNQVKNYRNAILAVAKIKKQLPELNFHYQIIGEGPLRGHLENLSRKKGIGENVHFLGRVDDISERYRHFSLLVCVSQSESFGLAVAEAMAVGLPIVASDIESLRELVTDKCGLFVNPRKPDEIAGAIIKLLEDDSLREKLGGVAKKRIATSFTQERMIIDTIRVYKGLLKG